ncbi:hypothetical protein EVAR_7570_1 [Eumeta japonica]|uniref:Uncharacterized protein n=1 Tax=Eumeta variegata TaxID=151549 RepID=A0A4C1VQV0_EUMVA|nr:hypothetical protein EVAR_7570_1 [Eumeta japonica]
MSERSLHPNRNILVGMQPVYLLPEREGEGGGRLVNRYSAFETHSPPRRRYRGEVSPRLYLFTSPSSVIRRC